ncbi:MAG: hypothetical protein GEEBNDBF_01552 [bacterium]|nr:hypothetical protein [bacterium]
MRRLVYTCTSLLLSLTLFGCGGGGGQQQAPAGGGQATGTTKEGTTTPAALTGAILYDQTNAYSEGLKDAITAEWTGNGGEIVETLAYAAGDTDFRSLLVKIKAKNPQVLFLPGYATDTALIIRDARAEGLSALMIGGDGWDMPELLQKGGKAVEGTYFTTHYVESDPSPVVQAFVKAYQAKYNMFPDAMAALGYDSALMIADALRRAGTTDGPALRDAIAATTDLPGLTGAITLDKKGDPQKGMVIIKIENGQRVLAGRVDKNGNPVTGGDAVAPAMEAPASAGNLPKEIKVGQVVAMTGEVASFGAASNNGTMLAVEEINAKQLLGPGVKLVLVSQDDQSTPTGAANAAKKLIAEQKVVALLGEVASKNSLAMAPIAQENKIPMISPASTNPDVTNEEYVFRACYLDTFQGQMIARYAMLVLKGEAPAAPAPPPAPADAPSTINEDGTTTDAPAGGMTTTAPGSGTSTGMGGG